ncbi:MAG TPA: hypothetical protein VK890_05855, partial [Bacteroidia bacterium]|nr:hypothetical protein [Bacteroidia bacterium]
NTGNAGVNKGFLPPQVALTNVTVAAPVTSPATGLIVYTTTAPTGGNGVGYYYWNGTAWNGLGTSPTLSNLTQGTGITSFTYDGTGAATVAIANTGVTANSYGNATTYPTFTVNAQGQLTAAGTQPLPASLPPNGTAGGNLSGTYPNPTVSKINGATVPAAGALTTGNVLQVNGTSSTTYGPVNIAGGSNYITGNLPVSNLNGGTNANATTFWRGDGTWANPTTATLSNLTQGTGITSFTYNGSSAATVSLANTTVVAGSYGSATTVPTYTVNAQGQITGAANITITASSGTVTNFSSGNLSPLFTTSVTNSTTTPALSYTLTHAAAYTILGNNTNASAAPTYFAPDLTSALFANQGYVYSVLHGDGSGNLYWSGVDLTTDVTNNLPVTNLNSGTGASSNTFWRGDGTWATPSGGSINGSGTNGYLALWTPNSTTLGTSVVQDDGTEVGVGTAPAAGTMLNVFTATGNGIYVSSNDGTASGIYAYDANGTAVTGYSSNGNGVYAFSSNEIGVAGDGGLFGGQFEDHNGDYGQIGDNSNSSGGSFNNFSGTYAYISYGGYGILSNGTKSTEIKDKNKRERVMFCNESPEVKFEDYGEGQLVNGKVHITLDSVFAMNVCISEKHPMHVFIELEGDCNGTYVANKTASGFDVVELTHGTSNTPFSWHIVCNRANEAGEDRDYAEKRFPIGPGAPKKPEMAMQKRPEISNPVPPAKPTQPAPGTKKTVN